MYYEILSKIVQLRILFINMYVNKNQNIFLYTYKSFRIILLKRHTLKKVIEYEVIEYEKEMFTSRNSCS